MAGKEGPRGPLIAAYEYAKHQPKESQRRMDARNTFTERLEKGLKLALQNWGIPLDEGLDHIIVTPEIKLETGRGDILARAVGIKDPDTGDYKLMTLDLSYGDWRTPFIPPKKPFREDRIGVRYSHSGNPVDVQTSDHLSFGEFVDDGEPKLKTLRKASVIMDYLIEQYEIKTPLQQVTASQEQ